MVKLSKSLERAVKAESITETEAQFIQTGGASGQPPTLAKPGQPIPVGAIQQAVEAGELTQAEADKRISLAQAELIVTPTPEPIPTFEERKVPLGAVAPTPTVTVQPDIRRRRRITPESFIAPERITPDIFGVEPRERKRTRLDILGGFIESQAEKLLRRQEEARLKREDAQREKDVEKFLGGSRVFPEGLPKRELKAGVLGDILGGVGEAGALGFRKGVEAIGLPTQTTVEKKREDIIGRLEKTQDEIRDLNAEVESFNAGTSDLTSKQISNLQAKLSKLDTKQENLVKDFGKVKEDVSFRRQLGEEFLISGLEIVPSVLETTKVITLTKEERKKQAKEEREAFAERFKEEPALAFAGLAGSVILPLTAFKLTGIIGRAGKRGLKRVGLIKEPPAKVLISEISPTEFLEVTKKGKGEAVGFGKIDEIIKVKFEVEKVKGKIKKADVILQLKKAPPSEFDIPIIVEKKIKIPTQILPDVKNILEDIGGKRFLLRKKARIDTGRPSVIIDVDESLFIAKQKGFPQIEAGIPLSETAIGFRETRVIKKKGKKIKVKKKVEVTDPLLELIGGRFFKTGIEATAKIPLFLGDVKLGRPTFGKKPFVQIDLFKEPSAVQVLKGDLLTTVIGKKGVKVTKADVLIKPISGIEDFFIKRKKTKPIPFGQAFTEVFTEGKFTGIQTLAERGAGFQFLGKGIGKTPFEFFQPQPTPGGLGRAKAFRDLLEGKRKRKPQPIKTDITAGIIRPTFAIPITDVAGALEFAEVSFPPSTRFFPLSREGIGAVSVPTITAVSKPALALDITPTSKEFTKEFEKPLIRLQEKPITRVTGRAIQRPITRAIEQPLIKIVQKPISEPIQKLITKVPPRLITKTFLKPPTTPPPGFPFDIGLPRPTLPIQEELLPPRKIKPTFAFAPSLAGITFREPRKEPKPSKIFKGFELRPAPIKPLKISPLKMAKVNLFRTGKVGIQRSPFAQPLKVSAKERKKRKRRRKQFVKAFNIPKGFGL